MLSSDSSSSPRNVGRRRGGLLVALIISLICFNFLSFLLNLCMVRQMIRFSEWQDNPEQPPPAIAGAQMDLVYEVPVPSPLPIYIMIPSVSRKGNPNYLLQVLNSFKGFPESHVYVFHNGAPGDDDDHTVWDQARVLYPRAHFIRNERPAPTPHPAANDMSLPLPNFVQDFVNQYNDTDTLIARKDDTDTRKTWRRKECYDFVTMLTYMVEEVAVHPAALQQDSDCWLIVNQDDAKWMRSFGAILQLLQDAQTPRVDLHRDGIVSVAFQNVSSVWRDLIAHARLWCDFKPIDWIVWDFYRVNDYCEKCDTAPLNTVMHIGKISSRVGRVD